MINYNVDSGGSEVLTKVRNLRCISYIIYIIEKINFIFERLQVMVKLELNLPWKPVLAWPWGVRYDVDPNTFLVTSHVESWDIEPWEVSIFIIRIVISNSALSQYFFHHHSFDQGVKQIFRKPTVKLSR